MTAKEIDNFGNKYVLSSEEAKAFATLTDFFEEEEKFILSLKEQHSLEVREDLLILFVQMYLLRFAIPYHLFAHNRFPSAEDADFLRRILYFCLVGRSVDDVVDDDSKMFKTYESLLLFRIYHSRLSKLLTESQQAKFDQYLFESTRYKSPIVKEKIVFSDICSDVHKRIRYFFCEIENCSDEKQRALKAYTGILLGGLDLNDVIADGYLKRSATVISNHAYHTYFNDEGKLLLDSSLIAFYDHATKMFEDEAEGLVEYCNSNGLTFVANILMNVER